jgi:hypothetical protein
MTYARAAATVVAAFLLSNVFAIAIHGFILAADYQPYRGTLLRDFQNGPGWQSLLLPVAHLCFICGLVWLYRRLSLEGSHTARGLKLGLVAWLVGQAPLWLIWYAEQPWPGSLIVKQLGLELLSSLAIGLTIAVVSRVPARQITPRVATTA